MDLEVNKLKRDAAHAVPSSCRSTPAKRQALLPCTNGVVGGMACRQDDAAEHMHTASVMRATASMAGPSGTSDRYKDLDGNDELLVFVEPQPEDVYISGISLYDSTILRDLKDGKMVRARSARGLGKSKVVVVGRCPGCPVAERR
jgi:hypothetical protein